MNERTSDASTGAPIETTPTTTNTNAGPDVEKQEVEHKAGSLNSSSNSAQPLLLKRIAPVLPHLRKKLEESESDAEWATNTDIVGTQIRAEEGNALKYRTCSWQKVLIPSSPSITTI